MLAETLTTGSTVFLILAVGLALVFEFVNGFHDTANAVATVIYTHTLRPWIAVVWSGLWNLIGVLVSTGGVAYTIVALLPVELVINVGSARGFAMVFALLISAILWNLGTWYLGLPASSTHTLVGSIMGVGLANALMNGNHSIGEGVNWGEAYKVFKSLLVSPVVGFVGAGLLLLLAKKLIRDPKLFTPPPPGQAPPLHIRALLMLTCTGVSYAHGSNDGQKGMGLILLILIGILPATYALNMKNHQSADFAQLQQRATAAQVIFDAKAAGKDFGQGNPDDELSDYLKNGAEMTPRTFPAAAAVNRHIIESLSGKDTVRAIPEDARRSVRTDVFLLSGVIAKFQKEHVLDDAQAKMLADEKTGYKGELDHFTKWIPDWVKFAVAGALGLGTMIGWKRIVVTVGEKIGKEHLNYAQGASAELVAMCTILAADAYHLPVSTTHVLSSGVAGTMAANHSGLQMSTLRNVLMAWILTLPVCVLLGAATFAGALVIVFNHLIIPATLILAGLIVAGCVWWLRRLRRAPAINADAPIAAGAGPTA